MFPQHRAGRSSLWLVPTLEPLVRWAMVAALLLALLAVRLEFGPADDAYPFLPFFPGILLAAWITGRAPALAFTVAAAALAWWFLIRPPGVLAWPALADAVAMLWFLGTGAFAAVLVSGLGREAATARSACADAQAAVAERRIAHAELQHRVANNLQLVASVLTQQARSIGGTPAAAALGDATRRLDALARLHRRLISIEDAPVVGELLEDICRTQIEAAGQGVVTLQVEVEQGMQLPAEPLTAIGMITSEALSNALKHGFAHGRGGHLTVRLRRSAPGRVELEVRDDGEGLPDSFEIGRQASLGLRIAQSLAERLHGTLSLSSDRGTVLRVAFPDPGEPPRS